MSLVVKQKLLGTAQVVAELEKFKNGVQRKIIRRSLIKVGKPIRDEMKSRVPVEINLLSKSIGDKTKTYKGSGVVVLIIGPRTSFARMAVRPSPPRWSGVATRVNPAFYGHLAEGGAKPHDVPIPSRGVTVQHPGHLGQPFLEPAWLYMKSSAVRELQDELWRGIFAEWNKT